MIASDDKIRCLIVDDAALMRAMIKTMLQSDPELEVIDTAGGGITALKKIRELHPDVVTLDVEMPGMDGISLLKELMSDCPVPVVMVSSHTQDGAHKTLAAMEAGAVDYVAKPTGAKNTIRDIAPVLISKLKSAAQTNMAALWTMSATKEEEAQPTQIQKPAEFDTNHVIAIGISCGGPASLVEIVPNLPEGLPPILITQHMPAGFTKSFADRLNRLCKLTTKEAEDNETAKPGHMYVAPGSHHMTLQKRAGTFKIRLDEDPPVHGHRPSVDKLFRSVSKACGSNCSAFIMTGMGDDGADALGAVKAAGGKTFAQNQDTCIVYGMPKVAIDAGHAQQVLALNEIVPSIIKTAAKG